MNLVIGSTSQLAHYFPENYIKISSRNIDIEHLKKASWDSVYITFAEQRIYDCDIDYVGVNYVRTMQIIDALLESSNKIVCYTSCELWNDLSGFIAPDTTPKFSPLNNEYAISKLLLLNKVVEKRKTNQLYNKVVFVHPFYFNSIHRSRYFLFGKIFDSIINKKKIDVGNLGFYRDMVHAKFVVEKSMSTTADIVVGAGKLFCIRDFVKDLYRLSGLDFEQYVHEDLASINSKQKLIMASVDWEYSYQQLLADTHEELLHGYNRKPDR